MIAKKELKGRIMHAIASNTTPKGSVFDLADTILNIVETYYQMPAVLSAAAADVLAERQRQVEAEGMERRYDDKYTHDELRRAAAVYAHPEIVHRFKSIWPWGASWMKLSTPRRDAVKAAALLIAEIERIDRAAEPKKMPTNSFKP